MLIFGALSPGTILESIKNLLKYNTIQCQNLKPPDHQEISIASCICYLYASCLFKQLTVAACVQHASESSLHLLTLDFGWLGGMGGKMLIMYICSRPPREQKRCRQEQTRILENIKEAALERTNFAIGQFMFVTA